MRTLGEPVPNGLLVAEIDARVLRAFEIGTGRTSAGDIDVLSGIPGTSLTKLVAHPDLVVAGTELRVGDLRIFVASLILFQAGLRMSDGSLGTGGAPRPSWSLIGGPSAGVVGRLAAGVFGRLGSAP